MSRASKRGVQWCFIFGVLVLMAPASVSCGGADSTPTPLPTPIPTVTLTPWPTSAPTLAARHKETRREFIGKWFDDDPGVKEFITIYRELGQLRMEYRSRHGANLFDFPIVESRSARGRRFQESGAFQFYIIDDRGDLQIWDTLGLITTARKIE